MSLERTVEFKVKGNPYTMKFPTVGEFLDIESRRILFSSNTYSQMLRSQLKSSAAALDFTDMASIVTVLCPKLIEDLKAKSVLDLDIFDCKELMTVWNSDIKAWVDGWMALLVSSPAEAEKPEVKKEQA